MGLANTGRTSVVVGCPRGQGDGAKPQEGSRDPDQGAQVRHAADENKEERPERQPGSELRSSPGPSPFQQETAYA